MPKVQFKNLDILCKFVNIRKSIKNSIHKHGTKPTSIQTYVYLPKAIIPFEDLSSYKNIQCYLNKTTSK